MITYAEPQTEPITARRVIVLEEAPKVVVRKKASLLALCKYCDSPVPSERLEVGGEIAKYCSDTCQEALKPKPEPLPCDWKKRRESIRKQHGHKFPEPTPVVFKGLLRGEKI